ncbi:MAG: hypothetical protein ACI9DJ_002178 [Algoriphagus sp.]|jgi:hypothetical protein
MKNIFKYPLVITLSSLFIAACSTATMKQISPETVLGRWQVQMISSTEETKSFPKETKTESVADQELYLEFNADGTYTTNSDIESGKITKGDGTVSTRNYKFSNGRLELTYDDAGLGIPITIYFNTDVNGNVMNLSSTKKDLIDAFADSTGLDAFTQAFIQIFLDDVVTFDFNLSLLRQ